MVLSIDVVTRLLERVNGLQKHIDARSHFGATLCGRTLGWDRRWDGLGAWVYQDLAERGRTDLCITCGRIAQKKNPILKLANVVVTEPIHQVRRWDKVRRMVRDVEAGASLPDMRWLPDELFPKRR